MNINFFKTGKFNSVFIKENVKLVDLRQLLVGQSFSGEIMNILNQDVQIKMGNQKILHAKLMDTMDLHIGDKLTFEIKENSPSQIVIKPIKHEEMTQTLNHKALKDAGLPVNEKNMQIVGELIKQNMPIDKQTIVFTIKNSNALPDTDIRQIVFAEKYLLEESGNTDKPIFEKVNIDKVNSEKIIKFSQFINAKMQLVEPLDILAKEGIVNTAKEYIIANQPEKAVVLLKQVIESFQTKEVVPVDTRLTPPEKQTIIQLVDKAINPIENQHNHPNVQKVIELFHRNADISEINRTIIQSLEQAISENKIHYDGLKALLQSEGYPKIIEEQVKESLFIRPEQFIQEMDKKEVVNTIQDRINHAAEKLLNLVSQTDQESQLLSHQLQEIKANINFYQSINQIIPYIQLPLKFNQLASSGDLYVFGNKSKKVEANEELSAFLRLQLEHLGATNIEIKMLGKKINTTFTLQEEGSLKLVEQNLPLLKERLENKGYIMNYTVEKFTEDSLNVFDKIYEELEEKTPKSDYSFDVRM